MFKSEFAMKESTFSALLFIRMGVAGLFVALTAVFFFTSFYVPSGSMLPTLNVGEICFATRVRDDSTLNRTDIVSFVPYTEENGYMNTAADARTDLYVKRIIGLPGDTVEITDGVLYINGEHLLEEYLPAGLEMPDFAEVTVPDDCYFMMGDNRNASDDSRVIGFIPRENLVAKTFFHTNSLTGRLLLSATA